MWVSGKFHPLEEMRTLTLESIRTQKAMKQSLPKMSTKDNLPWIIIKIENRIITHKVGQISPK